MFTVVLSGLDHYELQMERRRLPELYGYYGKKRTVSENDKESTGNALKSEGYPLTRCEE